MAWTTIAFLAAGSVVSAAVAEGDELDRYRWKARLVVVVAPAEDDPRLAEQRRLLDRAAGGMQDRDLVLVAAAAGTARAEALRRRFGIARSEFRAILVGKDGGAKLSQARPIGTERLFAEIDGMPMRRDEMRRAVR